MAGFGKNQIAKTLTSENPFVQHMDAEQRKYLNKELPPWWTIPRQRQVQAVFSRCGWSRRWCYRRRTGRYTARNSAWSSWSWRRPSGRSSRRGTILPPHHQGRNGSDSNSIASGKRSFSCKSQWHAGSIFALFLMCTIAHPPECDGMTRVCHFAAGYPHVCMVGVILYGSSGCRSSGSICWTSGRATASLPGGRGWATFLMFPMACFGRKSSPRWRAIRRSAREICRRCRMQYEFPSLSSIEYRR